MKEMYLKLVGPLSCYSPGLSQKSQGTLNDSRFFADLFEFIEGSFNLDDDEDQGIGSKAKLQRLERSAEIKWESPLTINYYNQEIVFRDFLFSYLQDTGRSPEKSRAINRWIYHQFIEPEIYKQLTKLLYQYNNSDQFVNLLSVFPIYFNPDYKEKLKFLLYHLKNKSMTMSYIIELRDLLNCSWDYVIIQPSLLSSFLKREYSSLLNYLLTLCEPLWKTTPGNFPHALLPELFDLITVYYNSAGHEKKRDIDSQFIIFFKKLYEAPLKNLHVFYLEKIVFQGKSIFLLEFLANIWANPNNLDQVNRLLEWLFEKNHSLVIGNNGLASCYQDSIVNKQRYLPCLLAQLKSESKKYATTCLRITILEENINTLIFSNPKQLVLELRAIYASHWNEIKDTPDDYLRLVNPNTWVQLAGYLAGVQLIPSHYYQFLIPTLTEHSIPFIEEELTRFPLNQFVLSKHENQLIFLPNSVNYYKITGRFLHCSAAGNIRLNSIEEARLAYADPEWCAFYYSIKKPVKQGYLKRETLKLVQNLVHNTIITPKGFDETQRYPIDSYRLATKAYQQFLIALERLPDEERAILYRQQISYKGETHVFVDILKDIVERDRCLTTRGMFFVQLILDYEPDFVFDFEEKIEQIINLPSMRMQSAQKIYAEENTLSKTEIIRRVMVLVASIVDSKFVGTNLTAIEFGGLSNRVTKTAEKIFNLAHCLLINQFEKAKYVYHRKIIHLINRAISKPSWSSFFTRATVTQEWLTSLSNQSLFSRRQLYSPSVILRALWQQADVVLRVKTQNLVASIVSILIRENNHYSQTIAVNLLMQRWLAESPVKPLMNQSFEKASAEDSSYELLLIVGNYLVGLIQTEFNNVSCKQSSFTRLPEAVLQRWDIKKRACQSVGELFNEATQIASELDLEFVFDCLVKKPVIQSGCVLR